MRKILLISLKLNFVKKTLGCYGLITAENVTFQIQYAQKV